MRDVWDRDVRTQVGPPALTFEEAEQLKQLMQTPAFKRASNLVYWAIAQESLARLGQTDADAKLIAEFNRSPDVVFGHLMEMCNVVGK